jgi:hypothetical protein
VPAAKDLLGQVFGRLTVLERLGSHKGRVSWLCTCQCGSFHETNTYALTGGHTQSCGCWKAECNRLALLRHGHASRANGLSPTYRSWQGMVNRCTNAADKSYKDYGGRGIGVHPSWRLFDNFFRDMGEKPPGKSLDRRDNEKNYSPNNCRWANKVQQARNTRSNKFVEYKGKRMTQVEFAEAVGHSQSTVSYRLRAGWTPAQIASTPTYVGNRVVQKAPKQAMRDALK